MSQLLNHHRDMPSFVGIQEDCERIMRQVEERLEQRVQDPATTRSEGNQPLFRLANCVADPECLSRIRIFSIPNTNFFSSRIRIKEFKYLNSKIWC
jgi:hypothetical protein